MKVLQKQFRLIDITAKCERVQLLIDYAGTQQRTRPVSIYKTSPPAWRAFSEWEDGIILASQGDRMTDIAKALDRSLAAVVYRYRELVKGRNAQFLIEEEE